MTKRQVILAILDGWGVGAKNDTNPIHIQGTPNLDYIKENFLMGSLQASSISIGLPWNEEGNSEVGHLTIGAGKILYQHYPRITLAIRDGSFSKNQALLDAFAHVKNNSSALNLIGLLTQGNIHASYEHLIALINLSKQNGVSKINLHLFTDGKDSGPKSFTEILGKLRLDIPDGWTIGSIAGRFYGLERDNHWERTRLAYEAITGTGPIGKSPEETAQEAYSRNLTDQHIEPHTINPGNCVESNDAIIFFDFREDGIRQIAGAFIDPEFSEFPTKPLPNLYIATFTKYLDIFKAPIAFPSESVEMPLGRIIAENGKTQLRIAETEKYAHVTYFFNGYREKPFENEFRILVPSEKVSSHAEKPKMQALEITARVTQAIREKSFDFILVNFANGDMVAHTGNYEATKIAVKTVDESVGALVRAALENDAALIITADHGNAESMMNPRTGEYTNTHDPSPVPIYLVGNEFTRPKNQAEINLAEGEISGILSDIAPTVLELLDIPKPAEITGQSLLKLLQ